MAKSAYDITPDATFAEARARRPRRQLDEMMANLDGTRAGDDIEALHDMRVASRRLRAALSVFADAFPPKPFRAWRRKSPASPTPWARCGMRTCRSSSCRRP